MYLITGVHGAVSRTARPLDPPGETTANKVEDVERTIAGFVLAVHVDQC